jgi:hypothetical protein
VEKRVNPNVTHQNDGLGRVDPLVKWVDHFFVLVLALFAS